MIACGRDLDTVKPDPQSVSVGVAAYDQRRGIVPLAADPQEHEASIRLCEEFTAIVQRQRLDSAVGRKSQPRRGIFDGDAARHGIGHGGLSRNR